MQFIVMAPNTWQGQWMNRQQLFSRIANRFPVIYTTGALMFWQRHSAEYKRAGWLPSFKATDGVNVCTAGKLMPRVLASNWLDKFARRRFCKALQQQTTAQAPRCLYLFHPNYADYLDDMSYQKLVYHAYDDFSLQGDYAAIADKELSLLARADHVFASSQKIQRRLTLLSGRDDIIFLPNGVDYSLFATTQPEPDELSCIGYPRVGYTGSINRKVDLKLLLTLSHQLTETQFVMIGNIGELNSTEKDMLAQLKRQPNVHFLGAKALDAIPGYIQHMTINIMSYKTDDSSWASAGYPLKLHEYLAAGKPVISADIEAVEPFAAVLNIAQSAAQWQEAIESLCLQPQTSELVTARQQVAQCNTWESRVDHLLTVLCL